MLIYKWHYLFGFEPKKDGSKTMSRLTQKRNEFKTNKKFEAC